MLAPAVEENPIPIIAFDPDLPAKAGQRATPLLASGNRLLFGLDTGSLRGLMAEMGEPVWRGRQLSQALYRERVAELKEITTLPGALRQRMIAEGWRAGRPRIAQVFQSRDGTERYIVECPSLRPSTVETVWMPEGDGAEQSESGDAAEKPRRRATLCVSSQIGCAVNCQFCLTARLGLQRNLTAGEIAGQVLAVFDRQGVEVGRDRVNLVFMGMGEPFLNYDAFMGAVRLLVEEVGLSPQRMTVSSSGIVPGIRRFAREPAELRPALAISLNAPSDTLRTAIMPINRKWPIAEVMEAVGRIPLRARERITFEYVLLGGVTDRPEDARALARLLRRTGLPVKVNLIAWNPGPGMAFATPGPQAVEVFRGILTTEGIAAYLRKPRGRDIYAACGQLKQTVER
ncbi:MAG: 23S rRNA (adenine(2503)-C(2))-methyltransferase RlmN [Terracidiphilus sp.]